MESQLDYWQAHAALEWQVELGADEAINETPIDRFELAAKMPAPTPAKASKDSPATPAPVAARAEIDPVMQAEKLAAQATTLDELRAAMAGFTHCDLKNSARNLVFSAGTPGASVMIVGESPGREEDQKGEPFLGAAGQMLDKMFAAIGLTRKADDPKDAIYITNALPWRLPANRDPSADEIAMMLPFLKRHIALADPKLLVLTGNWACMALLGRAGITRLRGQWQEVLDRPAMPLFHPAYLARKPLEKRKAWTDLQAIKNKLLTD